MEICLVSEKNVELKRKPSSSNTGVLVVHGNVKVDLPPGEVSSMLKKSLARSGLTSLKRARLDAHIAEPSLDIYFTCYPTSPASMSYLQVGNNSTEDNCLSRLGRAFGGLDNFRFGMKVKITSERDDVTLEYEGADLSLFILDFPVRQYAAGEGIPACLGFAFSRKMTDDLQETWRSLFKISAEVTVSVKFDDAGFQALEMDNLDDPLSVCKAVRANSVTTEVVIVCEGGRAKVRCHKGFLSAHSSVFKAMFESGMKEGTSGELKLLDMTEAGVQALLNYFYFWDLKEICKNCSIALELLITADKYDITRLQRSIQRLLLWKEANWFTVPMAVQLVDFSKKRVALMDDEESEGIEINRVYKAIEVKAMQVLKSKSAVELKECPEFQHLFQDPSVAMEFCTYILLFRQ